MEKSSPYLMVIFPFLFLGLWCVMCLLIAAISGWRRLAEHFRAQGDPSGQRFAMQDGKIGFVDYSRCLTVYTSPEGISLSIMFLFRLGHPRLFFPWSAIHNATTKRLLWKEFVAFEVGSPSIGRLRLPKAVFADTKVAVA